jgi:hypothetical protein
MDSASVWLPAMVEQFWAAADKKVERSFAFNGPSGSRYFSVVLSKIFKGGYTTSLSF